MHRLIVDAPEGVSVDHKNGNSLDNRRSNLRIAGQSNNMAAADFPPGRSGFRGVHWNSRAGRWHAQVKVNQKKIGLGLFDDPVKAARAYDAAAIEAFGEFANPNFSE